MNDPIIHAEDKHDDTSTLCGLPICRIYPVATREDLGNIDCLDCLIKLEGKEANAL